MRFAVIDTETTGLPDDPNARVIEVGIAVFDPQVDPVRPVDRWSSLVRPEVLTDEGRAVVAMVSQIPEADLLAAPEVDEVWSSLVSFLNGLPVRAYNEEFDRTLLDRTFVQSRWELAWGPPCGDNLASWRKSPGCIMEAFCERFAAYSRMKDDLSGPRPFRLVSAAAILALSEPDTSHRALEDAILAGQVALALDAGIMPPEPEILARITVRIDRGQPVFHAASAAVLPIFTSTRSPLQASFRSTPATDVPLPKISLRRTP
jgi:DNA polymerase III epsilon subunit-like protein